MQPHQYGKRNEYKARCMNTVEAAVYCGSTKSTFEKYRVKGIGPAFIKIGSRVVYDEADLDAWLAARRRLSTSDSRGNAHAAA
jgi:predicted DNA-binding transcriptional regulator AlpA